MVLTLVRNPDLDEPLRAALVTLWTAVSNAGGAVGFVAPVSEADVRPLAEVEFDRVGAGADDLVVALADDRPVGFGFLTANGDPLSRHWRTVKRLQRDPRRAGGEVGLAVLRELEAVAATLGLERVVLTVRGGTGRERYYQSHGYRLHGALPGWLKLGDDDYRDMLVLAKRVDGGDDPGEEAQEAAMQIVRLDPDLALPGYAHPGDAGLDLRARTGVTLAPGERAVVPTGVAVAVPAGCVGLVHPRSGLAARHGVALVNAPGTIDAGYRGEVQVVLINLDPREPVHIERGDRVAQLVVQRVETVRVEEVDALPESPRGVGGFGSTGRA